MTHASLTAGVMWHFQVYPSTLVCMSADSICAVLSVEGLELGAMECRGNREGRLK